MGYLKIFLRYIFIFANRTGEATFFKNFSLNGALGAEV